MIPFSGLLFFYLLFLGLLPAVVLGLLGKKLHYYGIFLCAAMLVIVFWQNGQLAALALFFLWEMALCCLFRRLPKRTRPLLWAAVVLALGPLGLIKLGEVLQPFSLFRLMGASYMSFRAVQGLLDSFATIQMVLALEEGFGLHLEISELSREQMAAPAKIARTIGGMLS